MAPYKNWLTIGVLSVAMGCGATGQDAQEEPTGLNSETDAGTTGTGTSKDSGAKTDAGSKSADDEGGDTDAAVTTPAAFDYENEKVELTADLVIPAGKTVRVGPGVTFHAAGQYKVQVLGTLEVEGSEDAVSAFTGGAPSSWHGIVVGEGGKLTLRNAKISGAKYGIYAEAGSDFDVADTLIDTSFKTAVVFSDGKFDRTRFTAAVPATIAITEEVGVDDPNGALTIIDASPTITNSRFDGASIFTDLVRIGGDSAPTFDHVYLHDAHCAFHSSGGTKNAPVIRNAVMEGFSYGFMTFTTTPIVEDSVFKNNINDFGLCSGTEANAPKLKNNFYGGEVKLDASCFRIKVKDASPASTANANAGSKL